MTSQQNIVIDDDLLYMIAGFSNGDARVALNTLEMAILNGIVKDQQIIINKEVIGAGIFLISSTGFVLSFAFFLFNFCLLGIPPSPWTLRL